MEAGEFENLPSKGKPIPLEEDPFEDPSLRMAHHLLRVNGFAPPWIEEASEIDRASERLRNEISNARSSHAVSSPSRQRVLDGLQMEVQELNRRILAYNLKCPGVRFHRLPVKFEND